VALGFWPRDRRPKLPGKSVCRARLGEKVGDSIWKHPNSCWAPSESSPTWAEVSIGSFLVNYFSQPDIAGLSPKDAAG